ncbi:E3 ubiquitin-protein ligase BRE1 [Rhodotorula toruloides]|uniref:E3 ubiquitin protein ligase n=1 Tax=Rhodotorula toruloides TaxID=5286 RepID=A0A511KBJ8_RHOTO|nr:E3 ubiquitin-protein ligase BRE1 [Rhodotorula toruloides]
MNGSSLSPSRPSSADPHQQRKRVTLVDPSPPHPSKKARLDSDAPVKDEDDDDEMDEAARKLDSFRKEAIFREMLSYKRQLSRALSDADALRSQRTTYEVRLSRVESAWQALVAEADLILPSTSSSTSGGGADSASSPPLTSASLADEELDEALSHRSAATKSLLSRLQSLHPSSASPAASDLEEKCRALHAESLQSREALRILRAAHEETVSQLEETHAALVRAERKFDRYQSATVAALEGRADPKLATGAGPSSMKAGSATPQPASGGQSPLVNGLKREPSTAGAGAAGAGDPPPSMGVVTGQTEAEAAAVKEEMDELRGLIEKRAKELEVLRSERVQLKLEIDNLKGQRVNLPDDVVSEQATFKLMQQHVQYLSGLFETKSSEARRAAEEAEQLRQGMESFRETVFRDASEQVTELQNRLTSHESDLSRLRASRDELRAETVELRAKETGNTHSLDELRKLAEARKVRLQAYASELRRIRLGKAAERGDVENVDVRLKQAEAAEDDEFEEGEVQVGEDEVVTDVSNRLKKAEGLLLALRDQLHSYAGPAGGLSAPSARDLVDSETRARADLADAQNRVMKLEAILGPGGRADVREMAEKLEEKTHELKVAQSQVKSQEAAANMLYGEIDRLSTAWATLDEQNASKVFNLAAVEEKLQRLSAEKAKSDNYYFASMRQVDALKNENAVLNKLAEKQQQKVEAAAELHRSIAQQLAAAEKEITVQQSNVRAHQDAILTLKRENTELLLRSEQQTQQVAELNKLLAERVQQAENEAAAHKRAEEQLDKLQRQLQQAQAKASTAAAAASGVSDPAEIRDLKKYNADLTHMLKCSSCNVRFKNTCITRCGHMFCRECVDARINTRQRKCGNCANPFSKDDILSVFF